MLVGGRKDGLRARLRDARTESNLSKSRAARTGAPYQRFQP